jgi:hypothetical protein
MKSIGRKKGEEKYWIKTPSNKKYIVVRDISKAK